MKKKIILIHGRKQRNSSDFEEIKDWIQEINPESEIIDLNWYDNYDLTTQNTDYLNELVERNSNYIIEDGTKEIEIIGYSTGALLVPMFEKRLEDIKVNSLYVAPLVAEKTNDDIKGYLNSFFEKSEKILDELKNDSPTKEVFDSKLEELKRTKSIDLYTRENYKYTRELFSDYRDDIFKNENSKFLFSTSDFIIDTDESIKMLNLNGINGISKDDFHHGLIFRRDKQIFKDWYIINKFK